MKTFVCILALAVASCKAGFVGSYSGGHEDSGQNTPSGGYDYSGPQSNHDAGAQGHNFEGGVNSFGQAHDFGGQGFNQDHGGAQAHAFAGQGHNFGGGQAHNFAGHNFGHGQDFSLPLLQHLNGQLHSNDAPQARGFDLGGHGDGGFAPSGHSFQGDSYLQAAHDLGLQGDFGGHSAQIDSSGHSDDNQDANGGHGQENHGADYGNLKEFTLEDAGDQFGHGGDFGQGEHNLISDNGHDLSHAYPVGEHTDVESPVAVPNYKHVTVPIPKTIHISVPKPVLVGVPQPYPVKVPVHKPVAVPVETEINIPVEKVVPYPVVKHVPYPVEKHVPIKVEKTVTVHVPQPYPVKIPVYKYIHHHKGH